MHVTPRPTRQVPAHHSPVAFTMERCLCVLLCCSLLLGAGPASARPGPEAANTELASSSCDKCMFAMRMIDDVLADPAVVASLVNLVDSNVCPSMKGPKCHNIAEGLIPVIIEWARAPATALQFCRATGVCHDTGKSMKLSHSLKLRDDSATCITCRLVVSEAQHMLNDSSVLDQISQAAHQACGMLPEQYAATCTEMVDTYEPMLVALIAHASSKEVCELMGVCQPDLLSQLLAKGTPLTSLQLSQGMHSSAAQGGVARLPWAHRHSVLRVGGRSSRDAVDGLPLGDSCDMCKMAVIEMHSLVANPSVQASLINYTKNICDAYPSFADTCKLYVDTYAHVVFTLLEQYLVPDSVCVQIGVCQPHQSHSQVDLMMLQPAMTKKQQPCDLAESLIKALSGVVTNVKTSLGWKVQVDRVAMHHKTAVAMRIQDQEGDADV